MYHLTGKMRQEIGIKNNNIAVLCETPVKI
jgi:hypothetical protein